MADTALLPGLYQTGAYRTSGAACEDSDAVDIVFFVSGPARPDAWALM
jgi:hypothetical protein